MILSEPELRQAIEDGYIRFEPPLQEDQWGPASVDLRLGFSFTRLRKVEGLKVSVAQGIKVVSSAGVWQTIDLKEFDDFGKRPTFCLDPGEFVLAMTHERITVPTNMIAVVEGRSTYARVGLSMHQTAPWIQPGWTNRPIVLEMLNNGPLHIELTPLVDRPCQLAFYQLTSSLPESLKYGARPGDVYKDQEHPIMMGPMIPSSRK